jgi:hypothetical protein
VVLVGVVLDGGVLGPPADGTALLGVVDVGLVVVMVGVVDVGRWFGRDGVVDVDDDVSPDELVTWGAKGFFVRKTSNVTS